MAERLRRERTNTTRNVNELRMLDVAIRDTGTDDEVKTWKGGDATYKDLVNLRRRLVWHAERRGYGISGMIVRDGERLALKFRAFKVEVE